MSINQNVFKTIEELESKLQELRKIVGMAELSVPAAAAPKKGRKSKKVSKEEGAEGADAAPKEKKPLNPFMVFQGRLRELLKANGYSIAPKEGFPQFAGYLNDKTEKSEVTGEDGKTRKIADFDSWTDEAILAERSTWVKPAVSKQAAAGKNKSEQSSTGSGESGEPVADEAGAPATEKPKRVVSEEQKAKMKAGREAAKAKRDAEKAAAAPEKPAAAAAEAAAVIAEVDAVLAAEPAKPAEPAAAPAKKPGKQLVKKAAPKKLDLRFREWEHEGTTYYKNERGDVLDQALTWVGRYDEESDEIDTEAEEAEFPEGVELIEA